MKRRMKVAGLTIDPFSNSPIMVLKDETTDESLPIWIGILEATAIASELEDIKFSRPMTHDLLKNILVSAGAKVGKVEVIDLKDNTFYALIHLTQGDKTQAIDARPSDAIALALRFGAPIFVEEKVIELSKSNVEAQAGRPEVESEEGKKWADILENLKPEDFGKFKM